MPVDLRALDADFYAWTGHKALGPTVGHAARPARAPGGDAPVPRRRPHDLPRRARALDLERAAVEVRGRHLRDRRGGRARRPRWTTWPRSAWRTCAPTSATSPRYALERLPEVDGLTLYGPTDVDRRGGVVPFTIEGMHPHDIAELCDREARLRPRRPPLRPAADARCSAWEPRRGPRSTSTTRARTWTGWWTPSARRARGVRALMDALYRDYILEHYKNPRNFGELDPHDLEWHDHNPLCGDELGVHIVVEDGKVADLRFHGQGCAISQAAASITSEELIGMTVEEVGAARRRLGDRPARHRDLPHAPQVRAAVAEGHARRHDRRRVLARVARSGRGVRRSSEAGGVGLGPGRRCCVESWITSPSSVTSTGTEFWPVSSRTFAAGGVERAAEHAPAVDLLDLRIPARPRAAPRGRFRTDGRPGAARRTCPSRHRASCGAAY